MALKISAGVKMSCPMRNSISDFSFTIARIGLDACKLGKSIYNMLREESSCNIYLSIHYLGTDMQEQPLHTHK